MYPSWKSKVLQISLIFIHHTTKYFILKENSMTLIQEGKIIIDDTHIVDTNHARAKVHQKKGLILEVL